MSTENSNQAVAADVPASSSQAGHSAVQTSEISETSGAIATPTTVTQVHSSGRASHETTSSERPRTPRGPTRTDTTTALQQALAAPSIPPLAADPISNRKRAQSTAIGPAVDNIDPVSKDEDSAAPSLDITLLLTSGARHPFVLDAAYLAKRNVEAQDNDPYNLSVYKLKELILREWREEWEQKPSSPSYIRLISFGKLLDDKAALSDLKFNRTDRNVVHMTIKPQDFMDEDDGKGAKAPYASGRSGDNERSPGCRCIIM